MPSGVVGAEDLDGAAPPRRHLERHRDALGLWFERLPETAAGTGDVEVAQARGGEAAGLGDGPDQAVHRQFGTPVRIGGHRKRRLRYRDLLGLAVDGGSGGEDELAHACLIHGFEQIQRSADVVAIVALRLLDRLADKRESCEVEHAVEACGENTLQPY